MTSSSHVHPDTLKLGPVGLPLAYGRTFELDGGGYAVPVYVYVLGDLGANSLIGHLFRVGGIWTVVPTIPDGELMSTAFPDQHAATIALNDWWMTGFIGDPQ